MSIDLKGKDEAVVPAVAEKKFPLWYMRQCSIMSGSPTDMRVYTEHIRYRRIYAEDGTTVIGAEFISPETDKDVKVIEKNIPPDTIIPSVEQEALVNQTIQQFMQSGGNLMALTFASMLLCVREEGIAQGVFEA